MFGLVGAIATIAMFGLTIEPNIGGAKISYSSGSIVQVLVGLLTAGGGSIAFRRYQQIKLSLDRKNQ